MPHEPQDAHHLFRLERPIADRDDITARLEQAATELAAYLEAFDPARFAAPQGAHWAPAEHLHHLVRSVGDVAQALRLPRLLLRARFGRGEHSRDFDETRALYRRHLDEGARASGRYLPKLGDGSPDEQRQRLLAKWERVNHDLVESVGNWSEDHLDRHRLPHPVIGKLTVREMLFFTIYHNAHHARRVRERAGDG